MSVAVYSEPYKAPAGALALAVHAVFFALLYFGFSWQAQPAATMTVELWQSLPDAAPPIVQPPPQPEPPPKVEEPVPPPQPQKIIKPEIVLPDKKKIAPKPVPAKPPKHEPVKQVAPKRDTSAEDQIAREQAARDQAIRDQAAVAGRMVDEYTAKIQGKIRRNIVMPPGVPDDARAEFLVTVLPGGSVLPPRLSKSSGNTAYDDAVERAILKSQPLPLPADAALFNKFREMKLVFKPVE